MTLRDVLLIAGAVGAVWAYQHGYIRLPGVENDGNGDGSQSSRELPGDWYDRNLAAYNQRRAELGRHLTKGEWVALMSSVLPMVTAVHWSIMYDRGVAYIQQYGTVAPKSVQDGWLRELGYTISSSSIGGLTVQQACDLARQRLAPIGWGSATCDQIRTEVCGNRTLFVSRDPASDDYKVRQGFGCPL